MTAAFTKHLAAMLTQNNTAAAAANVLTTLPTTPTAPTAATDADAATDVDADASAHDSAVTAEDNTASLLDTGLQNTPERLQPDVVIPTTATSDNVTSRPRVSLDTGDMENWDHSTGTYKVGPFRFRRDKGGRPAGGRNSGGGGPPGGGGSDGSEDGGGDPRGGGRGGGFAGGDPSGGHPGGNPDGNSGGGGPPGGGGGNPGGGGGGIQTHPYNTRRPRHLSLHCISTWKVTCDQQGNTHTDLGCDRSTIDNGLKVNWRAINQEGPYAGRHDALSKKRVTHKDDTSQAFYALYGTLHGHLSSAGFHMDLLPD